MLLSRKDLKIRYQKLSRQEKEVIGTALVKVNLGVFSPQDQRRAAAFLKGSEFIAKAGTLDEFIQFLHTDDDQSEKTKKSSSAETTVLKGGQPLGETDINNLRVFDEDSVVTSKEKIRDR